MKEKAAGISLSECGSFLTDAENTAFGQKASFSVWNRFSALTLELVVWTRIRANSRSTSKPQLLVIFEN
jgi:hypothetical protein